MAGSEQGRLDLSRLHVNEGPVLAGTRRPLDGGKWVKMSVSFDLHAETAVCHDDRAYDEAGSVGG